MAVPPPLFESAFWLNDWCVRLMEFISPKLVPADFLMVYTLLLSILPSKLWFPPIVFVGDLYILLTPTLPVAGAFCTNYAWGLVLYYGFSWRFAIPVIIFLYKPGSFFILYSELITRALRGTYYCPFVLCSSLVAIAVPGFLKSLLRWVDWMNALLKELAC